LTVALQQTLPVRSGLGPAESCVEQVAARWRRRMGILNEQDAVVPSRRCTSWSGREDWQSLTLRLCAVRGVLPAPIRRVGWSLARASLAIGARARRSCCRTAKWGENVSTLASRSNAGAEETVGKPFAEAYPSER
jgi:hypothetical protein